MLSHVGSSPLAGVEWALLPNRTMIVGVGLYKAEPVDGGQSVGDTYKSAGEVHVKTKMAIKVKVEGRVEVPGERPERQLGTSR